MRISSIKRKTAETDIVTELDLDGGGIPVIGTGCGFLDHMLTLFAYHGGFSLNISCKGDTNVDYHHTVEDVGTALGAAFSQALGVKRGINRYGSMILPMDEALVMSAADLSGRAYLSFKADFPTEKIGDFDTELVKEFFCGFTRAAALTLHVKLLDGENSHHIAEAIFKSVARALRQAVSVDAARAGEIPSTKGAL